MQIDISILSICFRHYFQKITESIITYTKDLFKRIIVFFLGGGGSAFGLKSKSSCKTLLLRKDNQKHVFLSVFIFEFSINEDQSSIVN